MSKRKRKTGLEIKVKLNDNLIQTKWVSLKSPLLVGDSHLYPVLFPPPHIDSSKFTWTPSTANKMKKNGFAVKNLNGAASYGIPIIKKDKDGKTKLQLSKGMSAIVNGKKYNNTKESKLKVLLEKESQGIVSGVQGWTLEFQMVKYKKMTIERGEIISPFFAQSLLFGFVFVVGILWVGFVKQREIALIKDLPGVSKRFTTYDSKINKEKNKILKDEPVSKPKKVVLKSAVVTRRLRYRIKRQKPVKQLKIAHLFMKKRGWIKKSDTTAPVDVDNANSSSDNSDSNGLPPTEIPEIAIAIPVVAPVAIAPVAMKQPTRAKPTIKIRPKRKSFPSISYPESAKHLGIEGKVRMRLFIDEKGVIYKVEILKKLHPILDRAAAKAAKRAKYAPAQDQYGKPIKATSVISITFKLEEEDE
jgi:TonB family protein